MYGRQRLWCEVYEGGIFNGDAFSGLLIWCEKCGARNWDCDEKDHERGGPHPEKATQWVQVW